MSAIAWVAGAALLAPLAAAATVPLMQEWDARRQTRREADWLAEYHHGPSAAHDIDTLMEALEEAQEDYPA